MNPGDHGTEMMSPELQDVITPNNQPGEPVETITRLLAIFSSTDQVTVSCALNTLDTRRVDVDKIPAAVGVSLFKKSQTMSGSYTLITHGEEFVLPTNITVYGFFDETCSISFTVD